MVSMCKKILLCLFALTWIFSSTAGAQENSKDKRSAFVRTVDALIVQIDIQVEDRNKVIEQLVKLSGNLKKIESNSLDTSAFVARRSLILRESLFTAENLIEQEKSFTIKTELIEFLRNTVESDQKLYDDYLSRKAAIQFQLDKQLAKVRAEQTLLGTLRRDLEKIKFYPLKKERFKFFLESASQLLDGLSNLNQ